MILLSAFVLAFSAVAEDSLDSSLAAKRREDIHLYRRSDEDPEDKSSRDQERKNREKRRERAKINKIRPSEHENVFRAPFRGCTNLGRQFIRGVFHE